jgi:hypothetical protein
MIQLHALREGLPLCRFTTAVPRDWPSDHEWAHDVDFRNMTRGGEFAETVPNHDRFEVCDGCKTVFFCDTVFAAAETTMTQSHEAACPHCHGTGKVIVPSEVATIEAYYFGCQREAGHYWWRKYGGHAYDVEKIVGPNLHPRIDGGFCPGSVRGDPWKRTRPEIEGEAALHHVDGWTVLSFWDRSVDSRGASNSNFVARGARSYVIMRAIAEAQFPDVWKRFKFEVRLVEPAPNA